MIFIDTSALIDSLTFERRSAAKLMRFVQMGEEIQISSLVLYEWLRGPRTSEQLLDRENILPDEKVVLFGPAEAGRAAELYQRVSRARTRQIDIAIAATAIVRNAPLWTLNPEDFKDIPDLKLV